MQTEKALWLAVFSALLWLIACENPISTESKSGNLSRTEYAVYTSVNKIYDPAWSPDRSQIAFVSRTPATDIYKMSADGDTLGLIKRFYKSINHSFYAISPDEQYIVYRENLWDIGLKRYNYYLYSNTQETSLLFNSYIPENAYRLKWSMDSRLLYYQTLENSIYSIKAITPAGAPFFSVALDSTDHIIDYSIAPDIESIAWSGQMVNSGNPLSHLWLYSQATGQQKLLEADSILYLSLTWSPDGKSIAYVSLNKKRTTASLSIFSLTNKTTRTLTDNIDSISLIQWADDGQTIYLAGSFYNDSREGVWAISTLNNSISCNCQVTANIEQFNTDGSFYILSFYNQLFSLCSFSTANKNVINLLPETFNNISHPAWSPDGASLVFSCSDKLCKIPAAGGSVESLNIDSPSGQYNPDFSPDGSLLVFDDNDEIYIASANGGPAKKIISGNYYSRNPVWSPDGQQIACTFNSSDKDSLIVFDYADGKTSRHKALPGYFLNISWSKRHRVTGSHLLFAMAVDPDYYGYGYELNACNPESEQFIMLIGNEGSLSKIPKSYLYSCWAPDAETIAWIQYDNYPGHYSLNIARIFADIK